MMGLSFDVLKLISHRGIPTGYLGNLEQRLNETEAALYSALAELRSLKNDQRFVTLPNSTSPFIPLELAPRELNANKMSRMAEWKEHPLTGSGAIERWRAFFSKYEIPPRGSLTSRKRNFINTNDV